MGERSGRRGSRAVVNRGWQLADYDWDPETGLAQLIYERVRDDTGEIQTRKTIKEQKTWHTPGLKMKI
jgi:hypothetical protein